MPDPMTYGETEPQPSVKRAGAIVAILLMVPVLLDRLLVIDLGAVRPVPFLLLLPLAAAMVAPSLGRKRAEDAANG